MVTGALLSIRFLPDDDRIEVTLRAGFTRKELDAVRALPGRRYEAQRRIWHVPRGRAAIRVLTEALGENAVRIMAETAPASDILQRVMDALTVRGYSPRTRKVYLGHLRRFLEWCGGGTPELPEDPVEAFQAFILELIRKKRISRSYQNQMVSALRFMCESVLGEPRMALAIPTAKRERHLPTVLSPGEVARMLKKPRNAKHRALLMLLYSAGLRVGEVVRLRARDLDMERGLVRVHRGKGRKDRYTLLARRAMETVKIYRDAYPTEPWLFPGNEPSRHLTERSVQRVVSKAAKAAGIEKHVTAHTLRHSFATHLLEKGTNLRIIQELLGHQSARTTQIYTHVAQSTIEAVRSPLDDMD